jgi:hypothetical protein
MRVVIEEEDGAAHEYRRSEAEDGTVVWREDAPVGARRSPCPDLTTAELLMAIEASLQERRRAGRGLKFRL